MASRQELSDFLAGVERRAFKHAMFALRDNDAALDVVQDAMLRLASRYGDRPAEELPMLFHRILRNAITDHFRRQRVRSLWTTPLSALQNDQDGEQTEAEALDSLDAGTRADETADSVERKQLRSILDQEIARLPQRQREAFLLRYWEDLNVAETALVMGCSEGSVKTHCSRAAHTLALALAARGIEQ
ncbi:MAG: RNA polymerase sigma factor [Burkholderiaceae bacterium]|nr:RNA polymerase sigma factor [Burkholderiaceae bacterium]